MSICEGAGCAGDGGGGISATSTPPAVELGGGGKSPAHADPNKALFYAAAAGDIHLARQALAAKADASPAAGLYTLVVAASVKQNSAQLVQLLVEHGAAIDVKDSSGSQAIHASALAGNLEALRLLLALRADVNAPGEGLSSPVQCASRGGSLACMQALVSANANLDYVDREGHGLLFHAVQAPTSDVLEYFIQENVCDIVGVGKHAVDANNETLLYTAARCGRARNVKLLLELKCDGQVNQKSAQIAWPCRGRWPTPLLAAARCTDVSQEEIAACVEALLAAHGDPTVTSRSRQNIFHLAAECGNSAAITLLAEKNKICCAAGGAAGGAAGAGGGCGAGGGGGGGGGAGADGGGGAGTDGFRALVNERDEDDMSPILYAAYLCDAEAARGCIKLGANVDDMTTEFSSFDDISEIGSDSTALLVAVKTQQYHATAKRRRACIRVLVQAGASIDLDPEVKASKHVKAVLRELYSDCLSALLQEVE